MFQKIIWGNIFLSAKEEKCLNTQKKKQTKGEDTDKFDYIKI